MIDRPVEVVFGIVADQTNEPRYNPQMVRTEKLPPESIGKGTRFRSAVTSIGRTAEILIECTGYEPADTARLDNDDEAARHRLRVDI